MSQMSKFVDRLTNYGINMDLYTVSMENIEPDGSEGEIWFDHSENDCQIRCYFHLATGPNGEQAESYSMALAMKS